MNKEDPVLTYRPLDSHIEAKWAPSKRSQVLDRVLASSNTDRVSQKLTSAKRRSWAVPSLATVGVAAAAVAVVISLSGSPNRPSQTMPHAVDPSPTVRDSFSAGPSATSTDTNDNTSSGNAIELVGYRVSLPANYKIGKDAVAAETNCTVDLHLTADETKRAVTTPNGDCPLVITSVVKDVPAGAAKTVLPGFQIDARGNTTMLGPDVTVTVYDFTNGSTVTTYVPAKLPDGSTVYVALARTNLYTAGDGSHLVSVNYLAQLLQLERGLHVEKTPPSTPASSGPTS